MNVTTEKVKRFILRRLESVIADAMIEHGPGGHCDGADDIAAAVYSRVVEKIFLSPLIAQMLEAVEGDSGYHGEVRIDFQGMCAVATIEAAIYPDDLTGEMRVSFPKIPEFSDRVKPFLDALRLRLWQVDL